MPVYNAAPFLKAAIDSILEQSYTDFELLAIDDSSIDESAAIIGSFGDARIRTWRHSVNLGIVETLNDGLAEARGEYIARMDADDISLTNRLKAQVECLDQHRDVGICGTWARRFGADRRLMAPPTMPQAIRCELVFQSTFVHPSVMLRTQMLRDHSLNYRDCRWAEDYDLWRRAADCFPLMNLPHALLRYRVHGKGITGSQTYEDEVKISIRNSDIEVLSRLGITPSDHELEIHNRMRSSSPPSPDAVEPWLIKLVEANRVVDLYQRREFERTVARHWYHACHCAHGWGMLKWPRMRHSSLSEGLRLNPVDLMKFLVRIR
jgi:glycosyltransferase involved in cell wall biosynthesis